MLAKSKNTNYDVSVHNKEVNYEKSNDICTTLYHRQ